VAVLVAEHVQAGEGGKAAHGGEEHAEVPLAVVGEQLGRRAEVIVHLV